jgi:hypothetical protein
MKKIYLITSLIAVTSFSSFGQSFYNARRERSLIFVGGMGLSTYFGELKTGNSFDTKPTINIGLQHYLSDHVNVRLDATWFQLAGNDADADPTGVLGRRDRNLSFQSNNFEISGTLAFSLFSTGGRYYRRPTLNFYGFTGLGLCYFNPTTEFKGTRISLPSVQTEGVSYSTFTPVIPMGLGLRIKASRDINIAFEGGFRMTFTDYLDDVSSRTYPTSFAPNTDQAALSFRGGELNPPSVLTEGKVRGNPKTNDAYFLLNVKLEYYLPTDFIFGNNSGHRKAQAYKRKKSNYRRAKSR